MAFGAFPHSPPYREEAAGGRKLYNITTGPPHHAQQEIGGPGQPEVQSFRPAEINEMVDPFTGDFSFNLPLLNVGGYPINLFYNSGVSMEDDASWVGLGWNLSPGSVNRNIRGLPDDFDGEEISREISLKDNVTVGAGGGLNAELFGLPLSVGVNAGINYNSYSGVGLDLGLSVSGSFGQDNVPVGMGGGLNLQLSSGNGFTFGGSANLTYKVNDISSGAATGTYRTHAVSAGVSANSRAGISAQFNHSMSVGMLYKIYGRAFQGESISASYPLAFAREVFTPRIETPMNGFSLSGRLQAGFEIQGSTVSGDAKIYYSWQGLVEKQLARPAFGYLYAEHANGNKDAILDFNREHEKNFEIENPQLPVTSFSYDVYSVSGQGISGMFRPFRTDFGTVSSNEINTLTGSGGLGGDVAAGTLAKVGVDLGLQATGGYSGRWKGENGYREICGFKKADPGEAETFYFKNVAEKNVLRNPEVFESLNGFQPIPLTLENQGVLPPKLKTPGSSVNWNARKREFRNTPFTVQTIAEKKVAGLEKRIYLFNANDPFDLNRNGRRNIDWTDGIYRPSHIGEIAVTRDDGTRYFYGLPVYNLKKREVSFNTGSTAGSSDEDKTRYEPGIDNSVSNNKGTGNYFNAVETPPYAYAYLLTAILSADYVDLTGDGPTPDDLGSYTRFNYSEGNARSKWRTPADENMVYSEKGSLANPDDDIGNYTYGEKQVFYLHSVETRNYVAEFKTSPRKDMHGVKDEDGGLDMEDRSMKLDSIILYAKADRVKNGTAAVPVKTVRFMYSYNLCRNNPSSENGLGKLTLERVVTSYRKSKKEMLSPYIFTYGSNPDYAHRCTDRWGQYKKEGTEFPLQRKFSFTPQFNRGINADSAAAAWALSTVNTPTGGTIKIFYESDDYGYVQDRRAMQMFRISGLGNNKNANPSDQVYTSLSGKNAYVFFELTEPVDPVNGEKMLREYTEGVEELFFQVSARVKYSGQPAWEIIKGFTRLKKNPEFGTDFGFTGTGPDNKYHRAWIRLDDEPGLDPGFSFHPFALATFDFIRRNYPAAGNVPLDKDSPVDQIITAFAGLAGSIAEAVEGGFNNRMINENIGSSINLSESFIRLNNPDKKKAGGGSRVKRLEIHDNWKSMTRGTDSGYYYGREYAYTTFEDFSGSRRRISSGVASYEPMPGGEENPFVQPRRYSIRFPVFGMETFPVENKMDMQPYGEIFYPAPAVGYGTVTIRNLKRSGVKSTATGFNRKEFYTARDFPTMYRSNSVPPARVKIPPLPFPLLQVDLDFLTAVQSHVIELNDMHGKPKADWNYRESDSLHPVSGVEYFYKTDPSTGKLDNRVMAVDKNGTVKVALAGITYDVVADEQENSSSSLGLNVQGNIDVIQTLVPTPVPMVWPALSGASKIFRSFTTTKVIMRSGILDRVIVHDLGAATITRNELYDELTGQVVLTSANNEYGDRMYSLGIPAHWQYPGMGAACLNIGYEVSGKTVSAGHINLPAAENLFVRGDELLLTQAGGAPVLSWVLNSTPGGIDLIDQTGKTVQANNPVSLKIIRSGRRNMQNLSIGKLVTRSNPVINGRLDASRQIIHAEANEFSENWQTYAGFNVEMQQYTCNCEKPSGCRYSLLRDLIQHGIDSLLRADGRQTAITGGRDLYRNLKSCWDKSMFRDSGSFRYFMEQHNLVIALMDGYKEQCRIEFPDPFLIISSNNGINTVLPVRRKEKGNRTERDPLTIKVDAVEFPDNCDDTKVRFRLKLLYMKNEELIAVRYLDGFTQCFQRSCWEEPVPPKIFCDISTGNTINPYRLGLLGSYRPKRSQAFIVERLGGPSRESGVYSEFRPFNYQDPAQNAGWQFVQENNAIDPFGKVLETHDPLDRYDADLYGYDHSLVIASAKNARYRQLAYDGFEDYDYSNYLRNTGECIMPEHFNFQPYQYGHLVDSISHTGYHSLGIRSGETISLKRKLTPASSAIQGSGNILKAGQLLGVFNPDTGQYLVSAWVYHDDINATDAGFSITVRLYGSGLPDLSFTPSGNRVDGWQQITGRFRINQPADSIEVELKNRSSRLFYIDDLRIHPFAANFSAYVYDPVTLKMMAELDENNFATLYEYDEEGNLTRVKKETEKGIITIQENRSGKPKQ